MPDPDDFEPDDDKKKDKEQRKNQEKFNECEKSESPIWNELKHYKVIDGKTIRTNGLKGKNQKFYQWDDLHKEIEMYDRHGTPFRAISPVTGRIKPKDVSKHHNINLR